MNFQLILDAPQALQIHLATILLAIIATVAILIARKGTRFHKSVGWVWATMMMTTSLVSLWISEIGGPYGFSFIHIFSLIVIYNVPYAIISVRRGNIAAHRNAMLGVAIGGIGIAGFFAMQRGRLMYDVLFAGWT